VIKLIVANGCSYTRGAELDDPAAEAWPAVLGARLRLPVVNLASDGGSNRRIVRSTVEQLDRLRAEHGVEFSEMLVVLMWTGMARNEYHDATRADRGNRPELAGETDWHRLGRWRIDEGDPAAEAYFRLLWDEDGAVSSFLVDWIGIDAFLRGHGARVGYVYAWDVLPKRPSRQAKDLGRLLDGARVYGGAVLASRNSFYEAVHRRFETGRLYHPLARAHAHFAGELADWLRGGRRPAGENIF
jgi:hypothetical protein